MPLSTTLRVARPEDLARVEPLFVQAGWLPSPPHAEQLRAVREVLGGEVFLAERDDVLAGCSACVSFAGTGWIGSVVVDKRWRGAGLGRGLTECCIQWLQERGARTVSLGATGLGRPVYERLGFLPEVDYVILSAPVLSPAPGGTPCSAGVREAGPADLLPALALDRRATGEDRGSVLRPLWSGRALVLEADGALRGFHVRPWWSPGGGTVLAEDWDTGLALLEASWRSGGQAQVSFPASRAALFARLAERGFKELRRAMRMRLGPPLPWSADHVFSTSNLFWA